jgi:hypothetical protein
LKQGRLSLTFQGRNARAHLCDQALRSHHIELRIRAGFMTLHSNIGLVAHHCKRVAGHGNLLTHGADLCVSACANTKGNMGRMHGLRMVSMPPKSTSTARTIYAIF